MEIVAEDCLTFSLTWHGDDSSQGVQEFHARSVSQHFGVVGEGVILSKKMRNIHIPLKNDF